MESVFPFFFFSDRHVEISAEKASEAITKHIVPARMKATEADGKLDFTISCGVMPGLHVWSSVFRKSVEIHVLRPEDRQMVYFPGEGVVDAETTHENLACDPAHGLNIACERLQRVTFSAGWRGTGMGIDRLALAQRLAVLLDAPVKGKLEFVSRFDTGSGNRKALAKMIEAMVSSSLGPALTASPMTASKMSATMLDLALQTLPHNYIEQLLKPPPRITPRHVKRAMDYIKAHARSNPTVDEVAQACDVSPRSLQYGFRQFLDTSPADFIRNARLQGARGDIAAGGQSSLTEIAALWGFSNQTRFNAYFEKTYGETPAELFRRTRR